MFLVIPVYEDPRSLETLLDNVTTDENRGYLNGIVVVTGSENKEIEWVVGKFSNNGFEITLLHNPNRYTPHALNIGIKYALAQGADLIQMLGAHSVVSDGYFRDLHRIAETEKDVGIISPSYDFFPPQNLIEQAIMLFHLSRLGRNWGRIYHIDKPVPGFGAGGCSIRREVFEKIGLYDLKFIRNQDNELYHRAVKAGFKGYSYPEIVYIYRPRGSINQLKKQNFNFGKYFALSPFSHSLKQAGPFLFYTFMLLLLLVTGTLSYFEAYKPAIVTIGIFMATLGIYLGAVMFETFRKFLSYGKAALFLPAIFIMIHFYYAMGSFSGFLFGFPKGESSNK
ncbi:MAG: glycosyltransferase [Ignavibacteriales bacterium]|nr:glycosyltransferase [Ignavibacteriales bacterium]